jgi:hypothetical protein
VTTEYKWTVLSNTTLGALMASINGAIILISLPVIFRGLSVHPFGRNRRPARSPVFGRP